MTVYNILKYPHVLLRKKSTPVETFSEDLKTFTQGMIDTMYAYEGIGLAAPQLGILKRIMVLDVSPYFENEDAADWHGSIEYYVDDTKLEDLTYPWVLVNPEIVKTEESIIFPFDGCLSFPGVDSQNTQRHKKIELHAFTPDQKKVKIIADGIASICLQHEMDHLEGVLFIDQTQEKNLTDKDIRSDVAEFEKQTTWRKKQKKLKPVDARKTNWEFGVK